MLVMTAGLLSLPALAFGADVTPAAATEYRDVPYVGSRNMVWVVAQLHLLLAGFVLGVRNRRLEDRRKALRQISQEIGRAHV